MMGQGEQQGAEEGTRGPASTTYVHTQRICKKDL